MRQKMITLDCYVPLLFALAILMARIMGCLILQQSNYYNILQV